MKFKFYIGYFLIGILLLPAINYKTFFNIKEAEFDKNTSSVNTYVVQSGSIINSIEIVGESSLVDEQSLQFNKAGTVTQVNFKAGDTVRKLETIAEIDNTDASSSIEEAQINLETARINLSQLYEGPNESNIMQAENSISNSESSLKIAKKEYQNLKISQQNSLNKLVENFNFSKKELESSKSNLELAKKELDTFIKEKHDSLEDTEISKSSTIIDIEDDFRNYFLDIEEIIDESDYILGVTKENKDKNNSYEDFFGAKDATTKSKAVSFLRGAISAFASLEVLLNEYDYSGDKEEMEIILNKFSEVFDQLYNTTDFIYKSAESSIVSIGSLSDSDINSIKNSMSSYRSSSLSKVTSVRSSLEKLKTLTDVDLVSESNSNTIASREESIRSQELSLEKKQREIENLQKSYKETIENYKLALESKSNDLSSKENSLKISKLNLEELLEGPTTENVRKAQNSIKQANIRLESANKSLEDYRLIAPFDGVIRKIDYMPGDNLTNDTSKYVYIENPDLLEITVMLDQIDIVKTSIGDKAIITFDAYKDKPAHAKISLIDTTPTQSSGVVYYEVRLILDDDNFDKKVLSGMTADVEIMTDSKEDILVIKTSSIRDVRGRKTVTIMRNGKQEGVEIETGISSSGMIEVISGLNIGDIVIEEEFSISSSDGDAGGGLFSIPTGRGGGGTRGGQSR